MIISIKVQVIALSEEESNPEQGVAFQPSPLVKKVVDMWVSMIVGSTSEKMGLNNVAIFGNGCVSNERVYKAAPRSNISWALCFRGIQFIYSRV